MSLSFVELSAPRPPGSESTGAEVWILHGILGSGRNWRAFGRRLARALPSWSVVTVDLRGHGDSPSGTPPHTVRACAADLIELARVRGQEPRAVIGHSFGGKVALALLAEAMPLLQRVWALDTPSGPQGILGTPTEWAQHDVGRVLLALQRHRGPFPSLTAASSALGSSGLSSALTAWMTTNLEPDGDVVRWRFDLDVILELISDYARVDAWPWIASGQGRARLLRAEHGDRWQGADLEGFEALEARHQAVTLAGSGHWVHVDAPERLLHVLVDDLSAVADESRP